MLPREICYNLYLFSQGSYNSIESGCDISEVCNATSNQKGSLTTIRVCSSTLGTVEKTRSMIRHEKGHLSYKEGNNVKTSLVKLLHR